MLFSQNFKFQILVDSFSRLVYRYRNRLSLADGPNSTMLLTSANILEVEFNSDVILLVVLFSQFLIYSISQIFWIKSISKKLFLFSQICRYSFIFCGSILFCLFFVTYVLMVKFYWLMNWRFSIISIFYLDRLKFKSNLSTIFFILLQVLYSSRIEQTERAS